MDNNMNSRYPKNLFILLGDLFMKQILIGISDYKTLIDKNTFYIDKTLLIKEIQEAGAGVILFPRPRRFGKTLNLSMLQYFYERTPQNHMYLFENTAIWQEEHYRKHQGIYPVISVTFKDVKLDSWENAYAKLQDIISAEFKRHKDILTHELIDELDRKKYQSIMDKTANESVFSSSLHWLCELLFNVYGQKTIVLIDEYDAPIHTAYLNDFYKPMLNFIRPLLSGVLKDNNFLERGVLTGILRVAKESIFSGLNNLKVCTLLSEQFSSAFGFTQDEVDQALQDYKLTEHRNDIKEWYNGYHSGLITVYNPWSIINCLQERGNLQTYWLNTSDNALVKQEIAACSEEVYAALQALLENQSAIQPLDDGITMTDLTLETSMDVSRKEHAVWNLLFYAGYITYSSYKYIDGKHFCELKIPNLEVRALYKNLVTESVGRATSSSEIAELRIALMEGDAEEFKIKLNNFVLRSISSHDLYLNECERNLHLFILGILVLFEDLYAVRSNRESGYGRYDIMLMPKKADYAGWIIELKKVRQSRKETLEIATDIALVQIKAKQYATELRTHNVSTIIAVGVAVEGKKLLIKHEMV